MKQHASFVVVSIETVKRWFWLRRTAVLRVSLLLAVMGLVVMAALYSPRPAFAATSTWTGVAGNTLWNDPGNWDTGVPGSGDIALFNTGASPATINVSINVGAIHMAPGYTGTITQATGATVTITGATFICQPPNPNFFSICQNDGAFIGSNGDINLNGAFTLLGGTFNAGSGNVFLPGAFRQVDILGGTFEASTGTTTINTGEFAAPFNQSGGVFNGHGTMDFICSSFNLTGGTFNATPGNTTFRRQFNQSGGIFNPNNGTAIFKTSPGGGIAPASSTAFHNLTINNLVGSSSFEFNLNNKTVIINGTLRLITGEVDFGTFSPQGDVVIENTFGSNNPSIGGGSVKMTFAGNVNQTFSNNGGANFTGTWTVDKSAGRVTLLSDLTLGSGQALNITSGTLDQGASFNLQTSNTLTVAANGILRDFGTGDLTLGGDLTNDGIVNINGGGTGCSDPSADHLQIRSTNTTQRVWSGNGIFSLVDVDVDTQTVAATPGTLTAFGSSILNNTTNWILNPGCPVEITSQPGNQAVCPGGSASFSVAASGAGVSLQWRKNSTPLSNGFNISGADTTLLAINPVGAGDVGSYDALATSTLGITATSATATLSLKATPAITSSPTNVTVCESQSASFTASATGDGISFQWRRNGSPLSNGGSITGANSPMLTINPTVAGDADSYDVVVSGDCSPPATSSAATLTVNTAPAITSQPTNQTACENESASFTVGASGTNLSFQWRKNGTLLSNSSHISGADTASLTINQVVLSDADSYDVVVSGTCSPSVTSTARTLTVNTAPAITSQPTNQTSCENGSASFTVAATGTNLSFQWRKNSFPLSNSGNISGADTATLTINPVSLSDADSYDVVVSGTCSPSVTSAAQTLTVNTAPAISDQPTSQQVCEGGLASLAVAATGTGLNFQWRRNGSPLSNGGNISGANSATLTINPATTSDSDSYDVVITGTCAPPATSNAVTLTVNGFSLSANSQGFTFVGGSGSVDVITGSSCSWTAVSNDSFIHITSGGGGTGNGTVNFTVDAVVSGPRSGTMTIAGKTFTVNQNTPSAADGVINGRILDEAGRPLNGVVIQLSGTQSRKTITDANGAYHFDSVETTGFYNMRPARANYSFNPADRSFSQLGQSTEATFTAIVTGEAANPLDTPEYFVRQHYLDFLGREPDEAGFNFWSDQILECGNDNQCIERRRENVSAAYFLSIEFQQTGGLVDGLYRVSYGVRPQFAEFMPDTRTVAQGVVVGRDGWQSLLEANKQAFVDAFVNRAAFHAAYDGMDNSLFVDTLINHTGVSFTSGERDALVSGLSTGTMTRAEALRSIAENNRFVSAKFNEAFVMMEYFGYLRRDADASGYAFWLNKLSEFNGNFERAEMVKAFIVSGEFRDRFPR